MDTLRPNICILGAGPGGAAAALKLSQLNIACTLIDKAVFPRDKVCGDAVSGKAATILRRIDPAILQHFEAQTHLQTDVWGIRFVAPNNRAVDVPFKLNYDKSTDPKQGYVSRRLDFDHLLVEAVKKRPDIKFHEGISIEQVEKIQGGFRLYDKSKSFQLETSLLIAANGANSQFSRHFAGLEKDERHHAGAVRAYFRNVGGLHPDNFIELHFLKEINPGYFWIFPLPGGYANVGLGMRSDHLSRRRFNLTKNLAELLEHHPVLRERFKHAEQVGKTLGFGLPLGSRCLPISGDHFMLVGDAGHLVDPLSGEGIGNAIYSGFIAAEQAQQCLEMNDFSARFMKAYDQRVARVLGAEMELSYRLQLLMARPWLVNVLANWVARNRALVDLISLMYSDLSVRKKVFNPLFWVKLLTGNIPPAKL